MEGGGAFIVFVKALDFFLIVNYIMKYSLQSILSGYKMNFIGNGTYDFKRQNN
jgi:hypothetical protein